MFDGFWHHFQGTCEYVLAKPCDSEDFIISAGNIKHEHRYESYVSLVRIKKFQVKTLKLYCNMVIMLLSTVFFIL